MQAGHDIRHVTLTLLRDDLPRASLALAELDAFVPDERPLLEAELPEVPGRGFRPRVRRAWTHLERLNALTGARPDLRPPAYPTPHREELLATSAWLEAAWKHCAPLDEALHAIDEEVREIAQLEQSLADLADLDIDLGRLHGTHAHVDLRLGTLPADNLQRLHDVLPLSGHLILNVAGDGENRRILVAGPSEAAETLTGVLHAAAFQPLAIPDSFDDNPQAVRAELATRRAELADRRTAVEAQIRDWLAANAERLRDTRLMLDAAEPYVSLHGAARTRGALAVLQGWLPEAQVEPARGRLTTQLAGPFVLETRRPRRDERHLVPVPVDDRGLLKPFAALVRQYGIPRFGELDPTLLFAITFAAMFGMMFGDIGHGAVIVLFGLWLRRRLQSFTYLFVLGGLSAMLFGWLYGSIFGVKHWIPPLWMSPMSDPTLMLTVALGWGVAFLTLGSAIAIRNRLLSGDIGGALFGGGGLFSLILYLALLGGLVNVVQGRGFPLVSTLATLVTLALLMTYLWRESDAPYGERAFTAIIETYEIVMGYIGSSLSFLRVAAFSLNHVALSLAVFTLADGMGNTGYWITVVLGNIFIIVLEGIIVGIQTLRLEYYEGFSRFYYGDGTPFRPLRVGRSPAR
jgi:V/A-type H+/Na+-transporting ATPase subunit I